MSNTKVDKSFCIFDYMVLILIFFGFFIFSSKNSFYGLLFNASKSEVYGIMLPIALLYLLLVVFLFYILNKLCNKSDVKHICLYIFFTAFILRLIVCSLNFYVPTNDFKNYYNLGVNAFYKNYQDVSSIVSVYHIPSFGGLAILNGIIMKVFSTSVYGMQLSNCVINSISCIFIFIIFKNKNLKIGAMAALLYAIYPANIFSTAVTINTHGSVLFNLIAIFFAVCSYKNIENKKCYLYAVLSMLMFVISSFFHAASYYTFVLTLLFLSIFIQLKSFIKERKLIKNIWICLLIIILGSNILINAGIGAMYSKGIINSTKGQPMSITFLVGLNIQDAGTLGEHASADVNTARQLEGKEQSEFIMSKIKENTSDIPAVINLFMNKEDRVWFTNDSIFYWSTAGKLDAIAEDEIITDEEQEVSDWLHNMASLAGKIDLIFIHIIYLLSAIGILFRKRENLEDVINIAVIATLGWIAVFMFTEVQSRYRCHAMPMFMVLASLGLYNISIKAKLLINKYIK